MTNTHLRSLALALAFAAAGGVALAQGYEPPRKESPGAEEKAPPKAGQQQQGMQGPHGGIVVPSKEGEYLVEIIYQPDGLRLFLYDQNRNPIGVRGLQTRVRLEFKDRMRRPLEGMMVVMPPIDKPRWDRSAGGSKEPNQPEPRAVMPQEPLGLAMDLSSVPEGDMVAIIHLAGMPSQKEPDVMLIAPFMKTDFFEQSRPAPEAQPKRP